MSAAVRHNFGLRARPARWFELLVAREDLTSAAEALARTAAVELETHSETTTRPTLPDLRGRLEEYSRLARRYAAWWPRSGLHPSTLPGQPAATLEHAVAALHAWEEEAGPVVQALEALATEEAELGLFEELLEAFGDDTRLDLGALAQAGPAVRGQALILPPGSTVTSFPAGVMHLYARGARHDFLLLLGPPEEVESQLQGLARIKGRALELPAWLGAAPGKALADRRAAMAEQSARHHQTLEALHRRHGLHQALGDIARLEWFITHVESLPASESFAWITGWCAATPAEDPMGKALEQAGVRALLRFPPPPRELVPPMVMDNPLWARPFELFARMFGPPGANEADPSRLLALVVPLMFGYMFGDVGQGLVLLLAGLALRGRWPPLRLLVPAGWSAMAFGLLFGSVFTREDLIPALWLHPLLEPITVLAAPLAGGVVLLTLGLLLGGIEAFWRGEAADWLRREAGLIPLYLGLALLFLTPQAAWLALAGLAWYLAGTLAGKHGLGTDLGHLLESVFQLAVNTLSFARVGAFALAHAGLAGAVVALAEVAPGPVALLILVLGNLLILALEGLVVSIQLTRLILFEFFVRFLKGEGRRFRPLPAPPAARP